MSYVIGIGGTIFLYGYIVFGFDNVYSYDDLIYNNMIMCLW